MLTLKTRSIAGLATVAATVMTIAFATPSYAETVTSEIRYSDLDLGTDAGKAALDKRILHAAKAVCGEMDQINKFNVMACRTKAIASARHAAALAAAKSATDVQLAGR